MKRLLATSMVLVVGLGLASLAHADHGYRSPGWETWAYGVNAWGSQTIIPEASWSYSDYPARNNISTRDLRRMYYSDVEYYRIAFRPDEESTIQGNMYKLLDACLGCGVGNQDVQALPILTYQDPAAAPDSEDERVAFASFAKRMVERYGPSGTYWSDYSNIPPRCRQDPGSCYRPIRVWEIWNEPNLFAFWNPGGRYDSRGARADQYRSLFRTVKQAIRSVDSEARVILGGLARNEVSGGSENSTDWLGDFLQADGWCLLDASNEHFYSSSRETVQESKERVKKYFDLQRWLLNYYGNSNVPIWVTEYGRNDSDTQTQAAWVRDVTSWMRANRGTYEFGPFFYFPYKDTEPRTAQVPYAGLHTVWGSHAVGGDKPAWHEYKAFGNASTALALPPRRSCY